MLSALLSASQLASPFRWSPPTRHCRAADNDEAMPPCHTEILSRQALQQHSNPPGLLTGSLFTSTYSQGKVHPTHSSTWHTRPGKNQCARLELRRNWIQFLWKQHFKSLCASTAPALDRKQHCSVCCSTQSGNSWLQSSAKKELPELGCWRQQYDPVSTSHTSASLPCTGRERSVSGKQRSPRSWSLFLNTDLSPGIWAALHQGANKNSTGCTRSEQRPTWTQHSVNYLLKSNMPTNAFSNALPDSKIQHDSLHM